MLVVLSIVKMIRLQQLQVLDSTVDIQFRKVQVVCGQQNQSKS